LCDVGPETEGLLPGAIEGRVVSALRQALEETLAADPDDLGTHMAYADYLLDHGDPADHDRGEFIQVQLALQDERIPSQERQSLRERERALLESHRAEWFGPLAAHLPGSHRSNEDYPIEIRFARGWLEAVHIQRGDFWTTQALAAAPVARLLRELTIDRAWDDPLGMWDDERQEVIHAPIPEGTPQDNGYLLPLFEAPFLTTLRSLRLGDAPEDSQWMLHARIEGELVARLVERIPRLEELSLFARDVHAAALFRLPLPHLRILQVYHLHDHATSVLADNTSLGRLTHLLFHGHATDPCYVQPGPYLTLNDLHAVLRSLSLRSLTHLRFRLSDIGDEGCEAIVRSDILKRLHMLDLKHGRITDAGARILASCPDLHNLRQLNLARNALTAQGIRLLEQLGMNLVVDEQHPIDDLHWLSEGDWE
jgi:uncharacterized protein (TIGR02996 family)